LTAQPGVEFGEEEAPVFARGSRIERVGGYASVAGPLKDRSAIKLDEESRFIGIDEVFQHRKVGWHCRTGFRLHCQWVEYAAWI
jgi:hypothetical protein